MTIGSLVGVRSINDGQTGHTADHFQSRVLGTVVVDQMRIREFTSRGRQSYVKPQYIEETFKTHQVDAARYFRFTSVGCLGLTASTMEFSANNLISYS
jgi:hypothetical protein